MPKTRKQLESEFRAELNAELKKRLPGCVIIKQDPGSSFQGVSDQIVLYEDKWAALELKREPGSARQPNQPYYVEKFNKMSYAAFVDPENYHDVVDDLVAAWRG